MKNINLITTDSYFNLFPLLCKGLKPYVSGLKGKNVVFLEEKVSLMAERYICSEFGGSFNTEVYSFGNFLRAKRPTENLLSREGSAMVIKKLLLSERLSCFKESRLNLAPSLFELIIQLKSAGVEVSSLEKAAEASDGILKNKLTDVCTVFNAYEEYLKERKLEDQSGALSHLPEIINNGGEIDGANVFIVGFNGFTVQIQNAMSAVLSRAKTFTVITAEGKNTFAFVNEAAETIRRLARKQGATVSERFEKSPYGKEGEILKSKLFNPAAFSCVPEKSDNVYLFSAPDKNTEVYEIAKIIKEKVMREKLRYKDFTVIIPDADLYGGCVKESFEALGVPCFLDSRRRVDNHPLVALIYSYIAVFRKGLSRDTFCPFFKNPLVSENKNLNDAFENYLLKYNINYGGLTRKLEFPAESVEQLTDFEKLREKTCELLKTFDAEVLLEKVNAEDKLSVAAEKLIASGEAEAAAITSQIFAAISGILSEMKNILDGEKLSYTEFGGIFASGVNAMELSIIPQYNDAVFVGDFKQAALCKAKYLFAAGLTSSVPRLKEDVALLTDGDLNALSEIKLLVEPKIKVVNHRAREETALGLSAFSEGLYLSYPFMSAAKKTAKSETLGYIEKLFTVKEFPKTFDYLTEKQGLISFSRDCGAFAQGKTVEFDEAASFYNSDGTGKSQDIAEYANREIKTRLNGNVETLIRDVTSPTALEDFYECPYRAFITHGLKVKERRTGEVDGLSVGKLMHEIFKAYVSEISEVTNEETSKALFARVSEKIALRPEYKIFYAEERQKVGFISALQECEKFCYKTFKWLSLSKFHPDNTDLEVVFGEDEKAKYGAIPLLDGKIKISGKIDRIDTYNDYFRIIDYKTGSADDTDKSLFSGTKLQLFLYAAAVKNKNNKLAGAYYMPIADAFKKLGEKTAPLVTGKTLNDEECLKAQDETIFTDNGGDFIPVTVEGGKIKKAVSEKTMQSFVDYALKISEKGAQRLSEGIIAPSPYGNTCEYCNFKSLCLKDVEQEPRSLKSVDDAVIEASTIATEKNNVGRKSENSESNDDNSGVERKDSDAEGTKNA